MFGSGPQLWSKKVKNQALGYQAFAQKRAELLNKQAGTAMDKGFSDALAQSQRGAERARASVLQMGQAGQGAAQASAMGRGLSGTTVQDNLARMSRSDTANQLSGLEAALAERYGAISAGRGQAKAASLGQLAAMYPQFAQMRTETLKAPTKQKSNVFGQVVGALGGKFLGALTGGLGEGIAGGLTDNMFPGK